MNEAMKKELMLLKRKKLTEKLLSVREKTPRLTTEEIVKTLNKYRKGQAYPIPDRNEDACP